MKKYLVVCTATFTVGAFTGFINYCIQVQKYNETTKKLDDRIAAFKETQKTWSDS